MSDDVESGASRKLKVFDPATETEIASYPLMDREAVNKSVARARMAFDSWRKSTFAERKRILLWAASVLAENAGKYADEIAAENGKTRFEALLADVFATADLMKFVAKNAAKFLKPVRVPGQLGLPLRKAYYCFEPKGVIGIISPWNYPFNLSAGPVIQAIAAGNTVVLKPSSQTTRSGLIIKEIFDQAGLPAGVVEVVTGNGSITGQALIENDDLNMLYFTGSTQIGREVYIKAAEHLIPAVMELGGNDVAIVTRNADLDRAANGLAWACFTNCGQTCISTELILVERAVYEPFMEKFTRIVGGLRLGKRAGEIGSMTMASQLKIVEQQLEDATQKGAKVITGGKRPSGPGFFYPPTLLADTNSEMLVRKEETFGPLKAIIAFDNINEAIFLANDSEYGLSGSVWTRDLEEGRMIAARIKTGSVNINDALMTPAIPSLPFGGVKKSGIGRNHGQEGLRAFTDIKSITEYGGRQKREFFWYPVPKQADLLAEKAMVIMFSTKTRLRFKAMISSIPLLRGILKK
jgi:acyl-CoA reductase-like NAD-dependent aldehyde dehydrogenase